MGAIKQIEWTQFKALADENTKTIEHIEYADEYCAFFTIGVFGFECVLYKNPTDSTDLDDFEANYK